MIQEVLDGWCFEYCFITYVRGWWSSLEVGKLQVCIPSGTPLNTFYKDWGLYTRIFECVKFGVFYSSFGSRCHSTAWLNGQTGPIIDTMEPYIRLFGCFSPNDQNTYAAAVTHKAPTKREKSFVCLCVYSTHMLTRWGQSTRDACRCLPACLPVCIVVVMVVVFTHW